MVNNNKISDVLNNSPSVELLRLRNREIIIVFFLDVFPNVDGNISQENIHIQLADYLEFKKIEKDEESEIEIIDTYETKAKKYIELWTNKGFLRNYQDDRGEIFYELSSHSSKTLDWLTSLQKEEYIGTDSKFKNIFNQLKELVEFTNDNTDKRVQLLEDKKLEIEQQIERIKAGEYVKVFEEFEIVPRCNQLNQSAKELLSDFKEVEDNFKEITKTIYQKHSEGNSTKSDILEFTFEALDELKESQQGKSFYSFWSFLLNPELQLEWESLINELYDTLEDKGIVVNEIFLKRMKKHLHYSGQKVYKANDKMAEKLSRIIREKEASKSEVIKNIFQDIKKSLFEISKAHLKPEFSLELETDIEINVPFERNLTFEPVKEQTYNLSPKLAHEDITHSNHLTKLFTQSSIDKDMLRTRIKDVLENKSQTTIYNVIENYGGIEKGLAELFGYISLVKEFKCSISTEKTQTIKFDQELNKSIQIPEIILIK